jgi:hypothetical protein
MPSKNTTTKDPPAPWAARSGQDAFGAFADLELLDGAISETASLFNPFSW